jgi:hypothetical protein
MSRHDDEAVAKIIAALISVPVAIIWRAWVLMVMWEWFVSPFGAAAIGMAHAAGLSLLLGYVTKEGAKTEEKTLGDHIATALVGPGLALAFGWVFHAFM